MCIESKDGLERSSKPPICGTLPPKPAVLLQENRILGASLNNCIKGQKAILLHICFMELND